jgi:hypothetical protein
LVGTLIPSRAFTAWERAKGDYRMRYPITSIYFDLFRLGCESSMVVGLRMMTLAAGGTKAMSEAHLMTVEKLQAASFVTVDGLFGLAGGRSAESIGRSAIAHYQRKVVANRKRLLR